MNKLLKIVTIVLLLASTSEAKNTFFMQKDKQLHMVAGTMVGLVSSSFFHDKLGFSASQSYFAGVVTSLLVGVAKEMYDSRKGGTGFSTKDILATGLGGMGGSVIVVPFVYKF